MIDGGRPLVLRSLRNSEKADDERRSLVRSVSLVFSALSASFSTRSVSASDFFWLTSPSSWPMYSVHG